MTFNFNPEKFTETLPYLVKGMVGIFAVVLIIIAVTAVLNKIASSSESNKKD